MGAGRHDLFRPVDWLAAATRISGGARPPTRQHTLPKRGAAPPGGAEFAVSADGTLVYAPGRAQVSDASLVWVDRKGMESSARAAPGRYQNVTLSADGKKIAIEVAGPQTDIWIYDVERGTLSRL